jgi:hypothetical protein
MQTELPKPFGPKFQEHLELARKKGVSSVDSYMEKQYSSYLPLASTSDFHNRAVLQIEAERKVMRSLLQIPESSRDKLLTFLKDFEPGLELIGKHGGSGGVVRGEVFFPKGKTKHGPIIVNFRTGRDGTPRIEIFDKLVRGYGLRYGHGFHLDASGSVNYVMYTERRTGVGFRNQGNSFPADFILKLGKHFGVPQEKLFIPRVTKPPEKGSQ